MSNEIQQSHAIADHKGMLKKAEEHIAKLTSEIKEREAEKAFYMKENAFLKESLRRIVGL